MTAIILAGGFGTRLQSIVKGIPKPMAPIDNKPFLEYLLGYLSRNNIDKAILSVGYNFNVIVDYFNDRFDSVSISYVIESTPLGTGGAIKLALKGCNDENAFVFNGDSFFHVDLKLLEDFHMNNNADITVSLKQMLDFDRYGVVEVVNDKIVSFREKAHTEQGYINGGVYCINKAVFDDFDTAESFSFELFLTENVEKLNIYGMAATGHFIDIGIPEDYIAAQSLLPQWVALL